MSAGDVGRFDYLVIGHVTRDVVSGGFAGGGTAAYAAHTAQALGCRVGLITSAADDIDLTGVLPGIDTLRIPSPVTTTFENRITAAGRVQTIYSTAAALTPAVVPPAWRNAAVVHLGPVAQECSMELVDRFSGAFVGVTPQGWMRRWDAEGRVYPASWDGAALVLARADGIVISEEDVRGDEALVARWAAQTAVLAVTHGARGCTVYADGTAEGVPGFPAVEVDPTGAGDVFAAVFFWRLNQGDSPVQAARLANCAAAISVTRPGLAGTPTAAEAARCLSRTFG